MNYLHGGSSAPRAKQETATDSLRADVTWRLLWRDDRYTDGSVPEEEMSYVFLAETPAAFDAASTVVLESGQPTPVAGRWVLQDSLSVSIKLAADDVLPLHQGHSVRRVLADA